MSTQAYDIVKLARSNKRPTGLDYIQNLCGDFLELHGDRCYADDAAIVDERAERAERVGLLDLRGH